MRVLHVGCAGETLPSWFSSWAKVRLDIDERVCPDIVASMTDMGEIGKFDAIFSSHCLEHLYPHEVPVALREFKRVLLDDGFAMIFVPDLEGLTISDEVLYVSPAGPITALDLLYGLRSGVEATLHMAHHTGFTKSILEDSLKESGFAASKIDRLEDHNLSAVSFTNIPSRERLLELSEFFSQPCIWRVM